MGPSPGWDPGVAASPSGLFRRIRPDGTSERVICPDRRRPRGLAGQPPPILRTCASWAKPQRATPGRRERPLRARSRPEYRPAGRSSMVTRSRGKRAAVTGALPSAVAAGNPRARRVTPGQTGRCTARESCTDLEQVAGRRSRTGRGTGVRSTMAAAHRCLLPPRSRSRRCARGSACHRPAGLDRLVAGPRPLLLTRDLATRPVPVGPACGAVSR